MQNALALAGERSGPLGMWATCSFSAQGIQVKSLITGGEKGNKPVTVVLHNNGIVLRCLSVDSPIFHWPA